MKGSVPKTAIGVSGIGYKVHSSFIDKVGSSEQKGVMPGGKATIDVGKLYEVVYMLAVCRQSDV